MLSGMCTAIWSPSKSALNAEHTSGCSWMALPSPAPARRPGCPGGAGSAHAVQRHRVLLDDLPGCPRPPACRIIDLFFTALMVVAMPIAPGGFMMKGDSSSAISLGRPHWCSFRLGPTVMTNGPSSRRACPAGSGGSGRSCLDHCRLVRARLFAPVITVHGGVVQQQSPPPPQHALSLRTMISA